MCCLYADSLISAWSEFIEIERAVCVGRFQEFYAYSVTVGQSDLLQKEDLCLARVLLLDGYGSFVERLYERNIFAGEI